MHEYLPRNCNHRHNSGNTFPIDVTFEMRTAAESKAFIQLIIKYTIKLSFIVETEKGQDSGETERERESEGESASVGRWRRQRQL